jgi:hypothetical protein
MMSLMGGIPLNAIWGGGGGGGGGGDNLLINRLSLDYSY